MNYFFWLLLNIGVPIFGPIFMLGLVSIPYGKKVGYEMIFESVKDGQLLWSAIALAAAAVYELITALGKADETVPHWVLELFIFAFSLTAFTSSILVMVASLKTYHDHQRALLAGPVATSGASAATGAGTNATSSSGAATATGSKQPLNSTVKASFWLTGGAVLVFGVLHAFTG